MLLAELDQVQQLLLFFICVYSWCCYQVVKPGPTSGPTVGKSLTNHASSSAATRTYGINCGQDSSSFSCNHRRDSPGIIQGGGKDPSVGICGISEFVNNTGYKIRVILLVVDSDQPGYRAPSRGQGKLPVIDNIMTGLIAFLRFMAVILSTEATLREEAAGLAAH